MNAVVADQTARRAWTPGDGPASCVRSNYANRLFFVREGRSGAGRETWALPARDSRACFPPGSTRVFLFRETGRSEDGRAAPGWRA
jgi:hypothetical protein